MSIFTFASAVILMTAGMSLIWLAFGIGAKTEYGKQLAAAKSEAKKRFAELHKSAPRTQPIVWSLLLVGCLLIVAGIVVAIISDMSSTGPPFGW